MKIALCVLFIILALAGVGADSTDKRTNAMCAMAITASLIGLLSSVGAI